MAEQNLQSWIWDTSLPSPQIVSFLIKANFSIPTNIRLAH